MRTLYLILLFIWLIIGYFICKTYLCGNVESTENSTVLAAPSNDDCNVKLFFRDTISNLNLISDDNFQFEKSNDAYLPLADDLKILLGNVVSHLGENPNSLMQIKGYYLSNEDNNTEYDDLGLARASMVKAYLLEQGANSDQLRTMGKIGNVNCMEDDTLKKGIAVAFGTSKQ